MQAIILAGGKGARLRPYTMAIPKPLMPVGDLPILEIILRQLKAAGATEVILAVGYMSQLFQAFFQSGERLGLKVSYSFEEKPLGTAGPLALMIDRLEDNFLVMNGDLLTTLNYGTFFANHVAGGAAATIATYPRDVKIDFGVLETRDGQLERYIEKPTYSFSVSMGVNAFHKQQILPYLKPGEYLDIPDLMMTLKKNGKLVKCYNEACYWLDIGRFEDYQTASEIFEARKSEFLGEGA